MVGVGKEVIEIWAILGPKWPKNENIVDPDRKNEVFKKRIFEASRALVKAVERFLGFCLKNRPYLDNFLTNPYGFLAYSGELGSDSPENAKKV